MRGLPLLLAAGWTLTYGYVTQSAIASDFDRNAGRTPRWAVAEPGHAAPVLDAGTLPPVVVVATFPDTVLDAGTLPPIVVEADAPHLGVDSAS